MTDNNATINELTAHRKNLVEEFDNLFLTITSNSSDDELNSVSLLGARIKNLDETIVHYKSQNSLFYSMFHKLNLLTNHD